ncbi:MAG TPA: endonuclease/exonuclease/phosphatase family protein, partial [Candidatus Limnocylindrales bacterium]
TPAHAAALEADPAITSRFAFRAMYPQPGAGGVGLLSRYPLTGANAGTAPALVEARLTLPDGTVVRVVDAHPFPAAIATATSFRIPIGFEAARRDADVARIRARIDATVAAGTPIIVVGDFNLTDREPAHADLARGLLDAHLEVGEGTGSTWRPDRMKFLPFGVMRIDYLLSGGGLRPVAIGEDCTPRGSDHCIVVGTLVVDPDPGHVRGGVPAVVTEPPLSPAPA